MLSEVATGSGHLRGSVSQPASFTAPAGVSEEEEEKSKTSVGDLKDPDVDQNILSGGKKKKLKKKEKGSNNRRLYSGGYLRRFEPRRMFRQRTNNRGKKTPQIFTECSRKDKKQTRTRTKPIRNEETFYL